MHIRIAQSKTASPLETAKTCRPRLCKALFVLVTIAWHGAGAGQQHVRHALGGFECAATSNGVLIAAQHGTWDSNTATLAIDVARELGAGFVVARQFAPDKIRIHVTQPAESALTTCAQESRTERARDVCEMYAFLVGTTAHDKPLRLYVEIHGNINPHTARQVEAATIGVPMELAGRVKEAYSTIVGPVREQLPAYPQLALLIEPVDRLLYTAACARKLGIFATAIAPRGIHFELPLAARAGAVLPGSVSVIADVVRLLLHEHQ